MPRQKIEIDWKEFEIYCAAQSTLREIADYFNCSEDTIERRVKEHYSIGFAEVFRRKRQKGLMSLRAGLFKLGMKQGNVAIYLSKNWLGMSDKQEIELSNKDNRPFKVAVYDKETKEEMDKFLNE